MRSLLVALTLGTAAATIAYAHGLDEAAPGRTVGSLTCRTNPDLGLVLGRTRGAACHLATADGQRQSYAALLPPGTEGEGARTLTWRVTTTDGRVRPGFLDGRFSGDGTVLRGERAELAPIDAMGETGLRLAADDARVTLGAR